MVELVSVALVGVEIDYHDSLYHHSGSEVVDGEGDVGVDAEAAAGGEAGVVEAAGEVYGPAELHGDADGEDGALGGFEHGVEDSPAEEESGEEDKRHFDVRADERGIAQFE